MNKLTIRSGESKFVKCELFDMKMLLKDWDN